jgi:hypothetical protein
LELADEVEQRATGELVAVPAPGVDAAHELGAVPWSAAVEAEVDGDVTTSTDDRSPRVLSRSAALRRRICYGPSPRVMEPRRPAPWLWRGVSWLAAAIGLAFLAPLAVLLAAGLPSSVASGLSSVGMVGLFVGCCARVLAAVSRPVPLDLAPLDDET